MKGLSTKQVEGMTIFGVGIAIGWFGLSFFESPPPYFSPILWYGLGLILVVLGFVYFGLALVQVNQKDKI